MTIIEVYTIWLPFISEQLNCVSKTSNPQDSYTIMVMCIHDGAIVGHLPCFIQHLSIVVAV